MFSKIPIIMIIIANKIKESVAGLHQTEYREKLFNSATLSSAAELWMTTVNNTFCARGTVPTFQLSSETLYLPGCQRVTQQ